jgi:DNA-directed RNA polymerase subunit beta
MQNLRSDVGLREAFRSSFPIADVAKRAQVDFCDYHFDSPKYSELECRNKGLTYAASLRALFRLIVWDVSCEGEGRAVRDIKEQDVYICDIPLMTKDGTFIINGAERVVVSQMQRSPGVFFDHDNGKTHTSGKYLFSAHIIPYKGAWLDIEFDAKDLIYVRIDRRRKILATTLLLALDSAQTERERAQNPDKDLKSLEIYGMDREEILAYFYDNYEIYHNGNGMLSRKFKADQWKGVKLDNDLIDAKTGKVVVKAGEKISSRIAKKLQEDGLDEIVVRMDELVGKYNALDVIDSSGVVIAEAGDELSESLVTKIVQQGTKFAVLLIDHTEVGAYIRNTLAFDKCTNREEALFEIFRVMRPGEPPTIDSAQDLFHNMFFNPDYYDFSAVGRVKVNSRIGSNAPENLVTLTKDCILRIMKILHQLKDGVGEVDDIDNLANRRIRSVGELIENQFRIGLSRMEKAVKERMDSIDIENAVPNDVINAKPVSSAIREFFQLSQLSQFMDQTNPLAEITHKRRISALGPGGLTRDRAGFDVRDVHTTHYGRICPIETPEGQNIGLINSLAIFAKINRYGFIETPYRKVSNGRVTDKVEYLSAVDEGEYTIAQANASITADGYFKDEFVTCRRNGDFINAPKESIDFMDVSPKQIISVAASLIPFLENDDASRALMGANMQRQAVPLIRSEAPLVGTGMEAVVARDSGVVVVAKHDGVIDQVDANRIVVRISGDDSNVGVDIYNLRKFQRSNMSTCLNQTPLVKKGDLIKANDIIADGAGTDMGELALGQNVLVGFMSWHGYTFEDAIVISERLVQDDYFTSIHIEEFEIMARDTKLGNEEITRDLPNVSDDSLKNLDEAGIVRIGAEVQAGDILVGKVTPKGETMMTPEEKLLRAIFGERAADVKDSSLRLPPGGKGVVVDVKIFSRCGVEKDERTLAIEQKEIESFKNDQDIERRIIEATYYRRLRSKLLGQQISSSPVRCNGATITEEYLDSMSHGQWRQIAVLDPNIAGDIASLHSNFNEIMNRLDKSFTEKVEKLRKGDELAPGVLKMVKVFVADKRKLQPGDKLAGRHGNKGIVSKIVPVEDMPYMEDGTPIDMILNPLGVTSRMNVGQVLETHLGWASKALGKKVREVIEKVQSDEKLMDNLRLQLKDIYGKVEGKTIDAMPDEKVVELAVHVRDGIPVSTPVFDGVSENEIVKALESCGLEGSGQVTLIDGRTGVPFDRKVTVGCIYMLKLHHMVDDKIHARSIGPYSLVTQQPLGGKAQFGGQRFGEMEVWALQAYGAAYTLQEILTVKSDDVAGRTKAYESIIKGDENIVPGIPESFNVLMKELCSLGLNFEFQQDPVQDGTKLDM